MLSIPQHLWSAHHSPSPAQYYCQNQWTHTQIHTHLWPTTGTGLYSLNYESVLAWTHTHTEHTVKEHPSTPRRVPVSCVRKIYMTRWQTDSGRAGVLPVVLLMLTVLLLWLCMCVSMCALVHICVNPPGSQNLDDGRSNITPSFYLWPALPMQGFCFVALSDSCLLQQPRTTPSDEHWPSSDHTGKSRTCSVVREQERWLPLLQAV